MSDIIPKDIMDRIEQSHAADRALVRELGERIGYGFVMQAAERIWDEKEPGAAHASYCCTTFLVPCPAREHKEATSCDWCCGARRVTARVAKAIVEEERLHDGVSRR